MGYFDDVNGPSSAPVIKLEENEMTRVRVIPAPEHTKYHKAKKHFQHSPPREQHALFGGYCSILCIGNRDGCIFHEDPYKWKASMKIPINVIEYELDKSQRLTGNRSVKLWIIGTRVLDGLMSQLAMNNISLDEVSNYDLLVKRTGSKQLTSHTVSIAPQVVEQQINWDFPSQGDYADDEYPFLIDYNKLFGFEAMTPGEQQKWLAERIEKGREKISSGAESPELGGYALPPTSSPSNFGAPGGFALGLPPTFGSPIGDTMPRATDYSTRPDPWGQGRTFGDLNLDELNYIVNTEGHTADDVKAAQAQIKKLTAPPPPPAPVAAPPPPPPSGLGAAPAPPPFSAPAPAAPPAGFAVPAPPAGAFPSTLPAPAPALPRDGLPSAPLAPAAITAMNGFPAGLPQPPAAVAPPAPTAPPINPKRVAVDTKMQNLKTTIFADHRDVRRFLGAWQLATTATATDEQLDQMAGVLDADPQQLASWLAQFPVPA